MKKIILVTCTILFASCMTEQKAVGWLDRHGKLPEVCAKAFPAVDSVGDLFFLDTPKRPVNIDYAGDLSALERRGDSLLAVLGDKEKQAEKVGSECAAIFRSFAHQVDSLQSIIKNLRSSYKAPRPDTVPAVLPHYNLNPPELAACQTKLAIETKRADKATTERDIYRSLFYTLLAVIIGAIIIFAILLFSKFIKK